MEDTLTNTQTHAFAAAISKIQAQDLWIDFLKKSLTEHNRFTRAKTEHLTAEAPRSVLKAS